MIYRKLKNKSENSLLQLLKLGTHEWGRITFIVCVHLKTQSNQTLFVCYLTYEIFNRTDQ